MKRTRVFWMYVRLKILTLEKYLQQDRTTHNIQLK